MLPQPSTPSRSRTALRVALFLPATMAVFAFTSGLAPRSLGPYRELASMSAAALITFLLTLLFTRWDNIALRDIGASLSSRSLPRLAAGFLLGAAMVTVQDLTLLAAGHIHWQRNPQAGMAQLIVGFALFSAIALREELAYRGYPLRRLNSAFGFWTAQLVVAAVFAIEHRLGGSYTWADAFAGVFLGSLLFGAASLLTRGLALPMGIHLAWNFCQWLLGGKKMPGLWQPIVDPGYEHYAQIASMTGYLIAFGGALAVLLFLRSKCARRPEPHFTQASPSG
jgi:membrane protease YdiL (CAAX protease family)